MDDLAKRASVSNSTIRDFEARRRVPIANNLTAVRRAFESERIEFLFHADGTPRGVAGTTLPIEEKRPPQAEPPRRSGRRTAKAASPKRR
jgi:transcriptional regulator with XRE-family HTH domain